MKQFTSHHAFQKLQSLVSPICIVSFLLAGFLVYRMRHSIVDATAYGINLTLAHNFRQVVPGRLCRSGGMSTQKAKQIIKNYGIKTIIDLRLNNKHRDTQGQTEEDMAHELGVRYFYAPMASTRVISPYRLTTLLDAFDHAIPPVWIHCSNGTHRSGFASLLWLITKENIEFNQAKEQLSLNFGFSHIERAYCRIKSGHPTQDSVVWQFQKEMSHKDTSFLPWLETEIELLKDCDEINTEEDIAIVR